MQLTSIKPPSVHVQEKLGATLAPLGVEFVDSKDLSAVELRFKDAKDTTVANSAFEGAVDGIKLLFRDSQGNGVRGVADGYSVLDTVAKLPGVTQVMALESFPLQLSISTANAEAKAAIDALLRPETAHRESIRVS